MVKSTGINIKKSEVAGDDVAGSVDSGTTVTAAIGPEDSKPPVIDEGAIKLQQELRKIDAEARLEVQRNMKNGILPDEKKTQETFIDVLKSVELKLLKVRNASVNALNELKIKEGGRIKIQCANVIKWVEVLKEEMDKL